MRSGRAATTPIPRSSGALSTINSAPYTVVGVLPAGFKGLIGNAEAWVPFAVYEPSFMTQRYAHGYYPSRGGRRATEAQAIAAVRGRRNANRRGIQRVRRQVVERNGGIALFIARRR